MGVFLVAVLSTNFIGRIKDSFKEYFNKGSKAIVETKTLSGEAALTPEAAAEATAAADSVTQVSQDIMR